VRAASEVVALCILLAAVEKQCESQEKKAAHES
jgi:hypothetical protein